MAGLELRVLDSPVAVEALEPAWWRLVGEAASPEPVLTPAWALAWWQVFGGDGAVFTLAAFAAEELVGLLPLLVRARRRRGVLVRTLDPWGTGEPDAESVHSDFTGPLVARGREAPVARLFAAALTEAASRWDALSLALAARGAPAVVELENALAERGTVARERLRGTCPLVALPARRVELESLLSLRAPRPLATSADGAGRLTRLTGTRAALDVFADLGDARFRPGRPFRRFHDAAWPKLAARGAAEIVVLERGTGPQAAAYQLRAGQRVYQYVWAHGGDEAAGQLLDLMCLGDALDRGCVEYIFIDGATSWRRALASYARREVVTVTAVSPSRRGQWLGRAVAALDAVADATRTLRRLRRPG